MFEIPFTKLHGLGNDFVLIDARKQKSLIRLLSKSTIINMGSRTHGVGFDQFLLLTPSASADAKLTIYNQDGSIAEMCGNGLRAVAYYLFQSQKKDKVLKIETAVGLRHARWKKSLNPNSALISCEMGSPTTSKVSTPIRKILKSTECFNVDVGNPHLVVFYFPKSKEEFLELGELLEKHRSYPKRTNVQFVRKISKSAVEVRVWERGVGPTHACGSGAVAVATVLQLLNKAALNRVDVRFPGGVAIVEWNKEKAWLEGPVTQVFRGGWTY